MKKHIFAFVLFLNISTVHAQNEGDSVFQASFIHEINLTFPQPSYWDSLTAYFNTDEYLMGNVVFDGVTYDSVGVKFKGNSSYNGPGTKKPFKVDMNHYIAGQNINGLKKFNLNNIFKDPSFLREKLACDFYYEHGIPAPRCTYIKVYINGTYWGLYNFLEEVDTKTYLDSRFYNNDGNIFKGDPFGDLRWYGNNVTSYYTKYELHSNETANDWTDLINLIDKINNSGSAFFDSLQRVLNTDNFIDQWAAMQLFVNLDSYIGSGHNYFIYHNIITDKFEWIAWDVNESFGNFRMNFSSAQIENLSFLYASNPAGSRPLSQNMLMNNYYVSELASTLCQWVQNDFSNAVLDSKIDSLANAIRSAVYADTKKAYTNQDFENNLSADITSNGPGGGGTIMGIKSFITARRNSLINELASYGCITSVNEENSLLNSIKFYPNPANEFITVEFGDMELKNNIILTNTLGQSVFENITSERSEIINVSNLKSGLYFIAVNGKPAGKISVLK